MSGRHGGRAAEMREVGRMSGRHGGRAAEMREVGRMTKASATLTNAAMANITLAKHTA